MRTRKLIQVVLIVLAIIIGVWMVVSTDVRVHDWTGRVWYCDYYSKGMAYHCTAEDGSTAWAVWALGWPQYFQP